MRQVPHLRGLKRRDTSLLLPCDFDVRKYAISPRLWCPPRGYGQNARSLSLTSFLPILGVSLHENARCAFSLAHPSDEISAPRGGWGRDNGLGKDKRPRRTQSTPSSSCSGAPCLTKFLLREGAGVGTIALTLHPFLLRDKMVEPPLGIAEGAALFFILRQGSRRRSSRGIPSSRLRPTI